MSCIQMLDRVFRVAVGVGWGWWARRGGDYRTWKIKMFLERSGDLLTRQYVDVSDMPL